MLPKQALIIALLVSAGITPAYAQEAATEGDRVLVVLSEEKHRDKMVTFQNIIEAYLGKYEIRLLRREGVSLPGETVDQIGFAREQIGNAGGSSALWVDFEKRTVNILVIHRGADENTTGGEQILTRSFPNLEGGWRAECEAMAAFVRFALSSWLEEPSLETAGENQNHSVQALDDERPWQLEEAEVEEGPFPDPVISGSVSYTINATGGSNVIQQGGSISGIVSLYDIFTVFLGVDILNYHDPPNSEDTMHRLPIFIGAGIFKGSSRWSLGLNLAFEMDIIYFSTESGQTYHRYNPGFETALIVRSKISNSLTFFASLGANVYLNSYQSETDNTTIYKQLQTQFCVGLEIWRFWRSETQK